jgi:Flp pilus assembly protein TadG
MRAVRRFLRRLGRDQYGTAAIEFGVIAPVFFAMLLGIVDIGRYMWTLNTIQYALDDGLRAGVVQQQDPDDPENIQKRLQSTEEHVEQALLGLDTAAIKVEATQPTSTTIEVTADTTYKFMFPIASIVPTTTINLRSTMPF